MMDNVTLISSSIILMLSIAYLLKLFIKRMKYINIIERFPGPPAYPIIGDALDIMRPRNERMEYFHGRTMKYAPIFRTWTGMIAEIHLTRPEHIEVIASSIKHIDKSLGYQFMQPWLGTGLLTSSGDKWHVRRKMITPTFHFKILDDFLEVFSEKSRTLVKLLADKASGQEFDVYPYITLCALDVICETAMGTQVNAQKESNSNYIKAIYEISELTVERGIRPWLYPNSIWKCSTLGERYRNCIKTLHGFTNKVIAERKATTLRQRESKHISTEDDELVGKKRRMAFLDLLLEASEQGHKLTDSDIREEVDTFMFEGHDTTTAGMAWALFLLGNYPDVQKKVKEELDEIFGGSQRSPTMKDISEMKYLEMVIKESLRLYPSVPFIGRKVTEEVNIDGYQIPPGTMIKIHIYHVHRCKDQFPDPDKFNPDNFLPEKIHGRHPYAYIPFSAGPRNCVGQKFAILEEKTILSTILREFRIESVQKQEDVTLMSELILRPESGVLVRLYPWESK